MKRYLFCLQVIFVLLIVLIIAGCGDPDPKMYPGPEVSSDKQAVIAVTQWERIKWWETGQKVMYFLSVDNKKAGNNFRHLGEVHVLPGRHNITVEVCIDSHSYVTADLCLDARAGQTYIVRYLTKGYGAIMWFENQRTGRPVQDCTSKNQP